MTSGLTGGSKSELVTISSLRATTLIAMAPITGGSPPYTSVVIKQLNEKAFAHRVAFVVDPSVVCDHTLRGYLITQRTSTGVQLFYTWDLLDKSGNRVSRLAGQTLSVPLVSDDWSSINAADTAEMVEKTLASVALQTLAAPPTSARQ